MPPIDSSTFFPVGTHDRATWATPVNIGRSHLWRYHGFFQRYELIRAQDIDPSSIMTARGWRGIYRNWQLVTSRQTEPISFVIVSCITEYS